jgi:hypothetical protein
MAVTIVPMPREPRLCIVGDVQADLAIPAAAPRQLEDRELVDSYCVALSDGSLIRARFHEEPCFQVVVEGAGAVTVDRAGKSLSVDWSIEWVNVASDHASTALADKAPASLPLFDRLAGEAV